MSISCAAEDAYMSNPAIVARSCAVYRNQSCMYALVDSDAQHCWPSSHTCPMAECCDATTTDLSSLSPPSDLSLRFTEACRRPLPAHFAKLSWAREHVLCPGQWCFLNSVKHLQT